MSKSLQPGTGRAQIDWGHVYEAEVNSHSMPSPVSFVLRKTLLPDPVLISS